MSFIRGITNIFRKVDGFASKPTGIQSALFSKGHHLPCDPVIVLLGSFDENSSKYISKVYPTATVFQPEDAESGEQMDVKEFAQSLVVEYGNDPRLLLNFPTNPDQCLEFEKYINGINLAIHFKDNKKLSDEQQLMSDWFAKRGLLMEFDVPEDENEEYAQDIQKFESQLIANIKL